MTTTSPPQVYIPSAVVRNKLLETFPHFNKNGNMKISMSKFKEVLHALRIHSIDEELVAMMRKVEYDQDRFIDVKEFMKLKKLFSKVCRGLE